MELREVIARAIDTHSGDIYSLCEFGYPLEAIDDAAQAALDAIAEAGFVIAPREPTEAMAIAGCDVLICNKSTSWAVAASSAYRAMIAAATRPTD